MSDGLSLSVETPPADDPHVCLHNFGAWLELNHPPVETLAGMLELLTIALYRQGRRNEGHEVQHVVHQLRSVSHDAA